MRPISELLWIKARVFAEMAQNPPRGPIFVEADLPLRISGTCKRGHVNAPRYQSGECTVCKRLVRSAP